MAIPSDGGKKSTPKFTKSSSSNKAVPAAQLVKLGGGKVPGKPSGSSSSRVSTSRGSSIATGKGGVHGIPSTNGNRSVPNTERYLSTPSKGEQALKTKRAELGNPVLRNLNRKLINQPGMFDGVQLSNMEKFLNGWMADWGLNRKVNSLAIKSMNYKVANGKLFGLFYQANDGTPFNPKSEEGKKYLEAANAAGINPVLFGMIIKNEWDNRAYEHILPFFFTEADPEFSYGVGQIQGGVAVATIKAHSTTFSAEAYPDLYVDGVLNEGRVKWHLFTDEKFNLLIAANYIGDLETQFTNHVEKLGIVVSDKPIPGKVTITKEQIEQITIINYNQGPSLIMDSLQDKYSTPEERLAAIERTIEDVDQVKKVEANREYVEEQLGVDQNALEPTTTP